VSEDHQPFVALKLAMKNLFLLAVVFLLTAKASQCSDSATTALGCEAFEWAYPIWTTAAVRWGASAKWGPPPTGGYMGQPSDFFQTNAFSPRRATVPTATVPVPPMALCNNVLCSGVQHLLNPGPVVSPNVDTLYAAAFLDMSVKPYVLTVANNFAANVGGADRFYSITFLDMYTNNLRSITNKEFPNGGNFCLGANQAAIDGCNNALHSQSRAVAGNITLPLNAIALSRVWSNGGNTAIPCRGPGYPAPLNQPFPADYTGPRDPDGCTFLINTVLTGLPATGAIASPYATFAPLLAPGFPAGTPANTCPYVYGEPPCGKAAGDQQKRQFYRTVCAVLRGSPPSAAQCNYINENFGSLGFHCSPIPGQSTCTPSEANWTVLTEGLTNGYQAVKTLESKLGVIGRQHPNEWIYLPFDGVWDNTVADMQLRAVSSSRLHWLVANEASAYWAAFTDSRPPDQRSRLNSANTYRVKFSDEVVPVDYAHKGFWSVTLYDNTWFLGNATVYSVRSNQEVIPQPFYISADCTGLTPCLVAPAGDFQLILRGYRPLPGLDADGDYLLPKIQKCKGAKGLGC
jgi:hypothetical protein